jgi:hypothetical protein
MSKVAEVFCPNLKLKKSDLFSEIGRCIEDNLERDYQDIKISSEGIWIEDKEYIPMEVSSVGMKKGCCSLLFKEGEDNFEVSTDVISEGNAGQSLMNAIIKHFVIKYKGTYLMGDNNI